MKSQNATDSSKIVPLKVDWNKEWTRVQSGIKEPDEVPVGWKNTQQLAKELNRGSSATKTFISRCLQEGTMEMRVFNILRGDGYRHQCPHYRPVVKG